jgi:hypothetical protein
MKRFTFSAAVCLLAGSAIAQSFDAVQAVATIRHAGRYELQPSGVAVHKPALQNAALLVQTPPEVIYRNTCIASTGTQFINVPAANRYFDDGRVPSTSSTAPVGAVNSYRVTQISLGYGTNVPDLSIGGPGASILVQVWNDYDLCADPATQPAPVFSVNITGLPGTTVAGQSQGILVDIPLPANFQFDLLGDADGAFQNVANSDTFAFAYAVPTPAVPGSITGPLFGGVLASCTAGNGTYYQNPGLPNDGTGLDNAPVFLQDAAGTPTCFLTPVINGAQYTGLWFELTGDFNDCNANGLSDLGDLAAGTSVDLNGNGEPDECELGPIVNIYCTSSTTTLGCGPALAATGTASATAASGFDITVSGADGQRQGLIFYGVNNTGFTPLPWASGSTSFLCVKPPTQRTPVQVTGGTAGQCNGQLQLDWNAFRAANPTSLGAPFTPGQLIYAQGWMRDPPAPKTTNLSNAVEFNLQP